MTTIKDVATRAGVSASTVSHVINNTRYVSDETSAKVVEAIQKLNYYQNSKAKGLVTGRSHIIGLVVSDITNPFFPELVGGVEKNAIQQGFDVFLFNTDYDSERAAIITRRLIEQKVDGAIIMTTEIEYGLVNKLTSSEIPLVLLDWGVTDNLVSNIKENFMTGIDEAINHLVELGHRKIAFISGPLKLKTANTRKEAFLTSMSKYHGIVDDPIIVEGDFKSDGGESAVIKILSSTKLPTAILVANDLMAIGAIKGIKSKGLRVPHDISVIGLDDIFIASKMDPPLTTINLPRYQIGEMAWRLLHSLILNNPKIGREEAIDTRLVIRGTTAMAPSVL